MRRALLSLLVALLAVAPAGAEDDHDQARAALRAGETVPLERILEQARRDYRGEFLEVELEHEHGTVIYEVKLLTPNGRIIKLAYDAKTAQLLRVKGKDAAAARRAAD